MQYNAEQNKQSKDQKRAKGVGLEEPRCQPSNSTHRRVDRAESAHADVSDGLTVCQIRRCMIVG